MKPTTKNPTGRALPDALVKDQKFSDRAWRIRILQDYLKNAPDYVPFALWVQEPYADYPETTARMISDIAAFSQGENNIDHYEMADDYLIDLLGEQDSDVSGYQIAVAEAESKAELDYLMACGKSCKRKVAKDRAKALGFYGEALGYDKKLQAYYRVVDALGKKISEIDRDPSRSILPMTRRSALKKIEDVKVLARQGRKELATTRWHGPIRFAKPFSKASHANTSKNKTRKSMHLVKKYKKQARRKAESVKRKVNGSGFAQKITKTATKVGQIATKVYAAPIRGAYLTLLTFNVWDMAAKQKMLLEASEAIMANKKFKSAKDKADAIKMALAWSKIVRTWEHKFRGKISKYIRNVKAGSRKKPIIIRFKKSKGADGYGGKWEIYVENQDGSVTHSVDPVTTAAAAAVTATPVIVTVASIMGSVAAIVGALKMSKGDKEAIEEKAIEIDNAIESGAGIPYPVPTPDGGTLEVDAAGNTIRRDSTGEIVDITDQYGNKVPIADGNWWANYKWFVIVPGVFFTVAVFVVMVGGKKKQNA
ncbi:MAG: hypothetical protein COA79_20350 [Planctomycetota bacterium]|nr:MAG: hypothetical protein COA79_20350 [Planctomycetota bacterium]